MDLYDFLNHASLGSPLYNTDYDQTGSSTWGWTDPESGREFVAAGLFQGAAMIEILPIGRMLFLGFLYVFREKERPFTKFHQTFILKTWQ